MSLFLWLKPRCDYSAARSQAAFSRYEGIPEANPPSIPLVPDGYFEIVHGGVVHPMFLEADLGTESSAVWKRKVDLYLKLAVSKEFEHMFDKTRLRVLVVVSSDRRMNALRRVIAQRTDKLFWFTTEDRMELDGLCGPIWMRPKVNDWRNDKFSIQRSYGSNDFSCSRIRGTD
jgi:hypothetical protein